MGGMRQRLLLVLVAALLAGCAGTSNDAAEPRAAASSAKPSGFHGIEPAPVPARPSYVLTTTDGETFDFAAETRGRPTYVYYGYVNCADECPTAFADIAAALRKTTPELREKTRVIYVSTDAKRDTPKAVRQFLDQFSSSFIGLVGTQPELDAAARAAGIAPGTVGPSPKALPGNPSAHEHEPGTAPHKHFGPLGYSVSHAAVIFAYDASDRLPVVYPGGVTPSEIAADLPLLADPAGTT